MRLKIAKRLIPFLAIITFSCHGDDDGTFSNKYVASMSMQKIWGNKNTHAAFTDLIKFEGYYLCVFREGPNHVGYTPNHYGHIRVIASKDGRQWKSLQVISDDNYDLRDPKFSITPQGKLMLLFGGMCFQENHAIEELQSFVSFAEIESVKNGKKEENVFDENSLVDEQVITDIPIKFQTKIPVKLPEDAQQSWLWRITWSGETAYGVAYRQEGMYSRSFLVRSSDGISYSTISEIPPGQSDLIANGINEVSLDFKADGTMCMAARIQGTDQGAYTESKPPYTELGDWRMLNIHLGGPLLKIIDDRIYLATRGHGTSLYILNTESYVLELEEVAHSLMYGDMGYPGLIKEDYSNQLWMSFYSGNSVHSDTAIYLMKITMKNE